MGVIGKVQSALDKDIEKVVALSSDKAVNPINLYGATKLVAEKIFIDANWTRGTQVQFTEDVVEYTNTPT